MSDNLLHVDNERLRADIESLSAIGRGEDYGMYRMAFSDADMEGRQWLADRLEAAGLETWRDGAANVFGRYNPNNSDRGAILIGSHLDSVPAGGPLDGALGVVIGLECVRRLKEEGLDVEFPVEVVGFSDEEGRFGGLFGSSAVIGALTPDVIHQATDLGGTRLVDAMAEHGLDAMEALHARRRRDTIEAYVELHIEQGPVLDTKRIPIGVVEEITGLFKWSIRLKGSPDHAGTTPMDMRSDAFQGLAEFAGTIDRILEEHGGDSSKATIGKISLLPGTANTVPGAAEFSLDVRDTSQHILSELSEAFRRALAAIARRRNLMFEFDVLSEVEPQQCDDGISDLFEASAKALGLNNLRMPSGAAHDCQNLARLWKAGMIFVPSKNGKSHSSAEWTHMDHIVGGADVLLNTVAKLANAVAQKKVASA